MEQTSSLRAHPAEHLWFGDEEEVKGCNNHVCMLVTKPSPLSALPWPCLKHRSLAEQVCNSCALDFLISFPLLGKFGLRLPVTWILKVRQKSLPEKKSSYLNSSQILLRSKVSRNLVTYAVLQSWPKEAGQGQLTLRNRDMKRVPLTLLNFVIHPRVSSSIQYWQKHWLASPVFQQAFSVLSI